MYTFKYIFFYNHKKKTFYLPDVNTIKLGGPDLIDLLDEMHLDKNNLIFGYINIGMAWRDNICNISKLKENIDFFTFKEEYEYYVGDDPILDVYEYAPQELRPGSGAVEKILEHIGPKIRQQIYKMLHGACQ